MPDLTIEYYYHCLSAEHFCIQVEGSSGLHTVTFGQVPFGPVEHDWSCTCDGFRYRKTCKHIATAKASCCGWYQFTDGGEPVNGKCPECNGEIRSQGHGV